MPSSDVVTAKEILSLVPGVSFGFDDAGDCVYADFTDEDNPYHGVLRHYRYKEEILLRLSKFISLRHLNLRKCLVKSLPYLGHLRHLEFLDIASNELNYLPDWIANLTELRYLNVGANKLTFLSEGISRCHKLHTLKAHKNLLKELPKQFSSLPIKVLNLYLNHMNYFPGFIWDYRQMEEFSWGLSCIAALPKNISNWKNLQWLSLVGNKLESLPLEICRLEKIKGMRLHKNRIKSLPERFGRLKSLEQLTLYCNDIERLPKSFYQLNFKKLNLAKNPLVVDKAKIKAEWLMV